MGDADRQFFLHLAADRFRVAPHDLEETLTALELVEYRALERFQPSGNSREDWRAAVIAAAAFSAFGGKYDPSRFCDDINFMESHRRTLTVDAPEGQHRSAFERLAASTLRRK